MLECDLGLTVSKVKSRERKQTASGEIHDANRGQFCFMVTRQVVVCIKMSVVIRSVWCVLFMILSFFTLKEIVNQRKSSDPPATERLYLFYSVKIPPLWKLEVSLLNLGIQIYVY